MITADGWFDYAIREPGPLWKTNNLSANPPYPGPNPCTEYMAHSAVGYLPGYRSRVSGSDRAAAHGIILFDGRMVQSYPVTAKVWHSASALNNTAVGMETEGGFQPVDQPLTPEQVEGHVRALRDLADFFGRPHSYWQRPSTLKEHRDVYATACPSGRIPWVDIVRELAVPPGPALPDGWSEPTHGQWVLSNMGKVVLSVGDPEAEGLGRIAKLFGDRWLWLRKGADYLEGPAGSFTAYWSESEGD